MRSLVVALFAALGFLLAACGEDHPVSTKGAIPGAKLSAHADQLLDSSRASFNGELAVLKGKPVVVNQWASWCGPCKFEFPFLKQAAHQYAGKVYFLGLNSNDSK